MNNKKARLFIEFYKSTLFYNVLITVVTLLFNPSIYFFFISLCAVGFCASILFKEFYKKDQYYFYYNCHIQKKHLILFSFLSNILIVAIILIILLWLNILYM